jgi:hypothetical protein
MVTVRTFTIVAVAIDTTSIAARPRVGTMIWLVTVAPSAAAGEDVFDAFVGR